MKYASNNIRNILIAGHAGSGKTTLTEALVYFSGAAERMGRVEDGTTVSDFDPEEAKRKASLSASVVPVEYEGIKYNLIDAPGLFDFEAGEYEGIRAAESVLVCVSGRSGVTVGAEKAFQLARKNGKATMVFVSKCDLENANYFKILEDMKIKFGSTICPCVVPAKLDDGTPVYINLFSQKAFKYEGGKQIQVDLPDIGHRFQGLIEAMSEAIAETDDELMEKFFGGEPFTTEEIVEGMRKGVKDGLITPVFCGSAVNLQALDMLLYNMHKLLPSPAHDAFILAENANGEPVELHCTEEEPTAAYVFKTVADPFVGKLSYLRVISGKVTAGEPLTNARTGEVEKISKPLTVIGKKQVDADGIGAGDIGAVAKLVSAKTGDTLCDASRVVKMPAPVFPLPSLFMAVTVTKKGDEGKISSALARLMEEDPTLSYLNNAETHQQIIGGLGEPIRDEMTISRNSRLSDKTPITYFSLGKGTSISQESYDNTTVYIGAKGCADFLIGDYAAKHTISEGDMLVVPSKTLCGVTTETGCIYTEIIIKKENNNMNKIIKSGEVMKLKDLISYEDGSITNIDVVSNDTMKFVLMAFDEGTGLTPHRAPGNAIIFALEGKAVIDYEGKDYTISAGENFRFDKNGLHSVTADERFKMGLLLVLE